MTQHTTRAHATRSPSSAYRWMNCPGSIRMSEGIENKSSIYADEGTAAHMLAQWLLEKSLEDGARIVADPFVGRVININGKFHAEQFLAKGSPHDEPGKFLVDEEMADGVQLFVDTVLDAAKEPGAQVHVEHRVNFSSDDEFGTADAIVYLPKAKALKVFDLKYGAGVGVEVADAEGNPNRQLVCYCEGARRAFAEQQINEIEIAIVQPRFPHPDGPVRSTTIGPLDLLDWSVAIDDAVEATHAPDAPLVPGDWCKWCPAAGACPAFAQRALAVAQEGFDDLDALATVELPVPERLTPVQRAKILDGADMLEKWLTAVRGYAYSEAAAGNPTPGYKLVNKVGRRKWTDEKEAAGIARSLGIADAALYTEPKLKTPAQVEKLTGKKDFTAKLAALAPSVSSGTTLAPVSDRRPEAALAIEDLFDDIGEAA